MDLARFSAGLVLLATLQAAAPAPAERKAVLQTLRLIVVEQLAGPVEFVVADLKTDGEWAFVQAEPQRPGGRAIDGSRLFPEDWENMDGLTTTAILKRERSGWRVVEWRIGATDAWYCGPLPGVDYDPCRR